MSSRLALLRSEYSHGDPHRVLCSKGPCGQQPHFMDEETEAQRTGNTDVWSHGGKRGVRSGSDGGEVAGPPPPASPPPFLPSAY